MVSLRDKWHYKEDLTIFKHFYTPISIEPQEDYRGLLDCLFSNSTLETLISKSTFDIAKNFNSTLDIHTPLYGPYLSITE